MKEDQMRLHFQTLEQDRNTMNEEVRKAAESQKELALYLKAFIAYLDEAIPSKKTTFATILNQFRFGVRE